MLTKTIDDPVLEEMIRRNREKMYFDEDTGELVDKAISDWLNEMIEAHNLTQAIITRRANMHDIYGYQILTGRRKAKRNKLLTLCIAIEMTLKETQHALKLSGFEILRNSVDRDAVIMFGIRCHDGLWRINNCLSSKHFQLLN